MVKILLKICQITRTSLKVTVVKTDQIGTPTNAFDLANAVLRNF